MLTESQRRRVWEGWLGAEIRANYFADLSNTYHRRQRWATWALLVTSSGAVVAFVARLPSGAEWIAPGLSILTAALSAYSLVAQNQKLAVDSADLHARWSALASEYERLWDNMYADDAEEREAALAATARELSKIGTAFPAEERRLLKWQRYVEEHHGVAAAA